MKIKTILSLCLIPIALVSSISAVLVLSSRNASVTSIPTPRSGTTLASKVQHLNLVASVPQAEAQNVQPWQNIELQFSEPLLQNNVFPVLNPAIKGDWVYGSDPELLSFNPSISLPLGTVLTVLIPAGKDGIKSSSGETIASPITFSFSVGLGSTLRLEQILAALNYLPVSFIPQQSRPSPGFYAYDQQGVFNWRFDSIANYLEPLWVPGEQNVILQGAIMTFERQHGLAPDGIAGPGVWNALISSYANNQLNTESYDYVYVVKSIPQTLYLYQDGKMIFSTPANTGISAAPTQSGTWPVFEHLSSTTMRGTNPDGSHYSDPGVPWVSYFHGGDALHGFWRSSFGYPQSLGCVELPIPAAQTIFPYTPVGTLVTVN